MKKVILPTLFLSAATTLIGCGVHMESSNDTQGSDKASVTLAQKFLKGSWKSMGRDGAFTVSIPEQLKRVEVFATNTDVQRYSNEDLEVSTNFGFFAETANSYNTTISNRSAAISHHFDVDSNNPLKHRSVLLFSKPVERENSLSVVVRYSSESLRPVAERILRSTSILSSSTEN